MALLLPARFDTWLADIPWRGNRSYPPSTGCYGRSSKIFPPTSSDSEAVWALTALRKVHYHRNATLRGHEENRRGWRVGASLSRFQSNRMSLVTSQRLMVSA